MSKLDKLTTFQTFEVLPPIKIFECDVFVVAFGIDKSVKLIFLHGNKQLQ